MSSAGTPWYLDPISKSFNGASEKGVDLRVPYHTPVTPLFPGTVRSVATGPYGQEVDVTGMLNGQPVTASYVHLDLATVAPGQLVGQNTQIGLSGGQNAGGYHPASPLYSSYPHIEFSLWPQGTTPYGGAPYDPMSYINAVQKSGGSVVSSAFGATVTAPDAAMSGLSSASGGLSSGLSSASLSAALASLSGWLPNLFNATASNVQSATANGVSAGITNGIQGAASGIGHGLLTAVHAQSLPDLLKRGVLIGLGLMLLLIIAVALTSRAVRGTTTTVLNSEPVRTATNTVNTVANVRALGR